jgi:hypothetical protein
LFGAYGVVAVAAGVAGVAGVKVVGDTAAWGCWDLPFLMIGEFVRME